jgi:hypothetical protein
MHPTAGQSSAEELLSCRRILVLGPSGAGKTYLSLRLGELLPRELIHLDAHFWKAGWISTPQAQWRETVAVLSGGENWIMDGTYESTLDLRIPAADGVIIVDDWSVLRLFRVLGRRFGGGDERRFDAPPEQKIDISYLRYILGFSSRSSPLIKEQLSRHGAGKAVVMLSGAGEVRRFLQQLEVLVRGGDG